MADGDDLAVVRADDNIGTSQAVDALVAAEGADQPGHRLVGHQVANASASIVVGFAVGSDDGNLVLPKSSLLSALLGVSRHLGSAADAGLVAIV